MARLKYNLRQIFQLIYDVLQNRLLTTTVSGTPSTRKSKESVEKIFQQACENGTLRVYNVD